MSQLESAQDGTPRLLRRQEQDHRRRVEMNRARPKRPSESKTNVSRVERIGSLAAGTILAAIGLSRKSVPGLLVAGIGGSLIFRGATGHCKAYEKLGIDTATPSSDSARGPHPARNGIHVVETILIDKPASELYDFWRDFSNLPQIMSHLEAVQVHDERRSHWIVDAPRLMGGRAEWDAEIIRDEPNVRIAWRSLPGSAVDQRGMVCFLPAAGDRGVMVRVDFEYRPPAGQVGHWIAKLLGEDPARQIHDDLRRLKQTLEIGEAITVDGQSRGSCLGLPRRRR